MVGCAHSYTRHAIICVHCTTVQCVIRALLRGRRVYGVSERPRCEQRMQFEPRTWLVATNGALSTWSKSCSSLSWQRHIGQLYEMKSVSVAERRDSHHFHAHPLQIGRRQSQLNCIGEVVSGEPSRATTPHFGSSFLSHQGFMHNGHFGVSSKTDGDGRGFS